MDIFNSDVINWILIGALVAAFVAYFFWPEHTRAQAEVKRDEETRKHAKPLVALASDAADANLFALSHVPLAVRANAALPNRLAAVPSPQPAEIRDALWTQQRGMITRLESELDYAQQADISDHFAIAAPANQPGALIQKTLGELEENLKKIRSLLRVDAQRPLWHGRAMVLMLSNRKLFDHVAWLTSVGLAASAPGAFMQAEDDIILIGLYATRLGGFMRPLTRQVSRAVIRCVGGPAVPQWVEYGLAYWVTDQIAPKPPAPTPAPAPQQPGRPAVQAPPQPIPEEELKWDDQQSLAIFEPQQWTASADDSAKLERLVAWSAMYVATAMKKSPESLLADLGQIRISNDQPARPYFQPNLGANAG